MGPGLAPLQGMNLRHWISLMSLALFGLTLTPTSVSAVEIDDITGYYTPLNDSQAVLNKHINTLLKKSVEETKSCDLKAFVKTTKDFLRPRSLFAKIFGGGVEEFAIGSKDIDKYIPEIDTSIYKDTPYSRSFIASGAQIIRLATVYPSIRIQGVLLGVDKLSHFFETGLELYEEFLTPEKIAQGDRKIQINKLVDRAIELEETNLGWTITGIKSYGDIHAHLQGAFFWEAYFKENGDWWRCENKKIKLKKVFDITHFSQVGWSEATQCNEYAIKNEETYLEKFFNNDTKISFQEEVDRNIKELEKKNEKTYSCPIDKKTCETSTNFIKKELPFLSEQQVLKITSPGCR